MPFVHSRFISRVTYVGNGAGIVDVRKTLNERKAQTNRNPFT